MNFLQFGHIYVYIGKSFRLNKFLAANYMFKVDRKKKQVNVSKMFKINIKDTTITSVDFILVSFLLTLNTGDTSIQS